MPWFLLQPKDFISVSDKVPTCATSGNLKGPTLPLLCETDNALVLGPSVPILCRCVWGGDSEDDLTLLGLE